MKYIKIIISCLITIIITSNMQHALAEDVVILKDQVLSLEKCLDIALNNNPNINVATKTSKMFQSKIGQAKSSFYPQVNLLGNYNRTTTNSGNSGGTGILSNNGLQFNNFTSDDNARNQFSGSLVLDQLIYDFGRTPIKVNIQKLGYNSSLSDTNNLINNITYTVKLNYYNLLKAKKAKEVVIDTIKQFELQLKQAQALYKNGVKSKYDITSAQVNLSNAKLNYIKSDNTLKIAVTNLNNTLGFPEAPPYELVDDTNTSQYDISIEDALSKSFENRSDYNSLSLKVLSAQNNLSLSKRNYWPTLSGFTNYNLSNQGTSSKTSWSLGASLNIPVFNGFLTMYQIKEARANLEVAKANLEVLRQNIYMQVEQAYINFNDAKEAIPVSEIVLKQAKENLDLTNGRYSIGVASSIEVQNAIVTYANAQLSYLQSLYDYNIARSNLEKTMETK